MRPVVLAFLVAGFVAATFVAPPAAADSGECIKTSDRGIAIILSNCTPSQCRVENDVPPRISCSRP